MISTAHLSDMTTADWRRLTNKLQKQLESEQRKRGYKETEWVSEFNRLRAINEQLLKRSNRLTAWELWFADLSDYMKVRDPVLFERAAAFADVQEANRSGKLP